MPGAARQWLTTPEILDDKIRVRSPAVQGYVERQLGAMSGQIAEGRAASAKMAAETAAMKAETHELQTKVRKCRIGPSLWSPAACGREGRDELQTKVPLTHTLNSLQPGMAVRHRVHSCWRSCGAGPADKSAAPLVLRQDNVVSVQLVWHSSQHVRLSQHAAASKLSSHTDHFLLQNPASARVPGQPLRAVGGAAGARQKQIMTPITRAPRKAVPVLQ